MSDLAPKGAEVRLEAVVKTFGAVRAVDGVTLTVRSGEFLTLLGPSGSGKTTTLACIAGFAVPTEGDVLIEGRPVTFDPPFERNVGMVFQNYALFPHMTVAENLAFPLRMRKLLAGRIRERIAWALALVRLAIRASSRAASSSGSPWPAPSSSSLRCFSWTSPSGRWTRSSAPRCSSS